MAETILEARNLRKQFGGLVAVDDVSMAIERGSVHAIIGPNGAGKTTFFNLLTGVYKPTSGSVFKGQDITAAPLHRRAHLGLGRSFQITNIFPNLTVLENVRLSAQAMSRVNFRILHRADTFQSFIDRAMEVLTLVGLESQAHNLASTLPHGGKRKLELAILLAPNPEVLLLDEPTAGMASEQVPELMGHIDNIRREGGRTTVMHLGKLLAEGTPAEVAANTTVQNVYLGELYGTPDALSGDSHA